VRTDKRRPALVVQSDRVREARVQTFLVVPITSRLHLAELPGNVRLARRASGLSKDSVANVYDVQKVMRADFAERVAVLAPADLAAVDDGLRLALGL
jgi:mRNA interferase MazF